MLIIVDIFFAVFGILLKGKSMLTCLITYYGRKLTKEMSLEEQVLRKTSNYHVSIQTECECVCLCVSVNVKLKRRQQNKSKISHVHITPAKMSTK